MRRNLLLGVVAALAIGAFGTAAPAFAAHEWTPVGGRPLAESSNLSFTIEGSTKVTLTCTETLALGKPLAGKIWETAAAPVFIGCTKPATASGIWKVTDETATETGLEIPIKGAVITVVVGTCEVIVAPTAAATLTKQKWTNGTSAIAAPSTWEVSGLVPIEEKTAGCTGSGGATTAKVTATFHVLNAKMGATEAIKAT